jgi:hypothetical protein
MKKNFHIKNQGIFLSHILVFFLMTTACSEQIHCPKPTVPSREFILAKSDSAYAALDRFEQVRADAKAKGIMLCGMPDSNLYFREFCDAPIHLDPIYRIVGYMLNHKDVSVSIAGNIDHEEAKTAEELSLQRAKFVKAFFVKCGVEETRMTVLDYKDTRPMDDNSTPVGRFFNRRVEFRVLEDKE